VAGIATVAAYALVVALPGPFILQVVLVGLFGPLLVTASLGLYHLLAGQAHPIVLQLATAFNVLGAAIFTMMGLVQLAIGRQIETVGAGQAVPPALPGTLVGVQLGLDVAWDVFIGLGTLLFAISVWRDPRFGWIVGLAGVLIALGLLALNLWTFPTPPANRGLLDLGPLIGLWYLAVTLLIIRWLLK
jgi:hypothetical protein